MEEGVMPKEFIDAEGQIGGEGVEPHGVVVKWNRDMYVQLATVRPDGEEPSGQSGIYVDLDRDRINRLIRYLRRARDQAFGKDE